MFLLQRSRMSLMIIIIITIIIIIIIIIIITIIIIIIIRTMMNEVGNKRIIFVSMFGFLVFMQLRLALLMYRKSVDYK